MYKQMKYCASELLLVYLYRRYVNYVCIQIYIYRMRQDSYLAVFDRGILHATCYSQPDRASARSRGLVHLPVHEGGLQRISCNRQPATRPR